MVVRGGYTILMPNCIIVLLYIMSGLTGYLLQDGITDLSNVFLGKSSIVNISGDNTFSGTNTFNGVVNCNSQLQLSFGTTIGTSSTILSTPLSFFYLINTGAVTITLPTPSTDNTGSMILFKRYQTIGSTTYNVVGGGSTIFGLLSTSTATSVTLANTIYNVQLVCNGTNWFVVHAV
jgi:hypothetical protein